MFDLYVVRCGSKNRHQKDMCSKENGLCAQNMLTILHFIVNIIGVGDLYDHIKSMRIFTMIMNEIFICTLKIMRQMAMSTFWICYSSHTYHVFQILEVGAKRKVSASCTST